MRKVAGEYMLMQVGISLFHEDEDGGGYVARPLNFYIFPGEVFCHASRAATATTRGMPRLPHPQSAPPLHAWICDGRVRLGCESPTLRLSAGRSDSPTSIPHQLTVPPRSWQD